MDKLNPEHRSWNMSRIRSRNTRPERVVRSLLHRAGFRFRLNVRTLPGSPDIVLPRHRCVIFVHGCFWHRHPGCRYCYTPKSRVDFWNKKFEANVSRDKRTGEELEKLGWRVIVVWECEIGQEEKLKVTLSEMIRSGNNRDC
jgi:DNA mismatch endonuclease (patch repair protein)